jgi:hypothetical protein
MLTWVTVERYSYLSIWGCLALQQYFVAHGRVSKQAHHISPVHIYSSKSILGTGIEPGTLSTKANTLPLWRPSPLVCHGYNLFLFVFQWRVHGRCGAHGVPATLLLVAVTVAAWA